MLAYQFVESTQLGDGMVLRKYVHAKGPRNRIIALTKHWLHDMRFTEDLELFHDPKCRKCRIERMVMG